MSDITSVSGSGSSSLAALTNTKRPRVAADTQEAGESDFASAICSFSNESLALLSEAGHTGLEWLEAGIDSTVEGVSDLGDGIAGLAEDGLDAIVSLAQTVESTASSVANSLGSAATSVAQSVESTASGVADLWDDTVEMASTVAGAVTDGAEKVLDVVGSGSRNVASYVALGNSAVRALLNELV